jgi:hypothetical protein
MKKYVIGFILGVLFSGSIALALTTINASNISYDETHSVKDKIDDLYLHTDPLLKPVLLWTNPSPNSNFEAQTISLDLSEYKYVIIVSTAVNPYDILPRSSAIIPVGNYITYPGIGLTNQRQSRNVNASTTGIIFKNAFWADTVENNTVIPYKIYGIKGELDIDIFEAR